ncbi:tetratricopeptide repeat protein [Actinoplanes sp. NPDC049681]|uniref:tetratricopeptide repeat protein n=1 Tax=Actinoplanes sp. NPDC049681 TaxID=3363905 RepID=UPI0037A35E34
MNSRLALARRLNEDTLANYQRVLGDDHPTTVILATNLAADLDALGRHAEASKLRQQFRPQDPSRPDTPIGVSGIS